MADEKASPDAPPAKSKLGLIIGILVAVLTLVGGSVAGAILGPQLLGGTPASAEEGEAGEKGSNEGDEAEKTAKKKAPPLPDGEPAQIVSVELPPVVVDLRDEDGRTRHLKVGLSAELMDESLVEEFPLVIPRGREAALGYLRSLTFEEVADPKKYEEIKKTLSERVVKALGEHRVHRILLIEFVAQ